MTIYREDCAYRRPTADECERFSLDNPDYWYVEIRPDGSEAIIHDSVGRLADRKPDDTSPYPIIVGWASERAED